MRAIANFGSRDTVSVQFRLTDTGVKRHLTQTNLTTIPTHQRTHTQAVRATTATDSEEAAPYEPNPATTRSHST